MGDRYSEENVSTDIVDLEDDEEPGYVDDYEDEFEEESKSEEQTDYDQRQDELDDENRDEGEGKKVDVYTSDVGPSLTIQPRSRKGLNNGLASGSCRSETRSVNAGPLFKEKLTLEEVERKTKRRFRDAFAAAAVRKCGANTRMGKDEHARSEKKAPRDQNLKCKFHCKRYLVSPRVPCGRTGSYGTINIRQDHRNRNHPYFGSSSFNINPLKKNTGTVSQRVASATRLNINDLRNHIRCLQMTLEELQKENRTLKIMQNRQERALRKYEGTEAELPSLMRRHREEHKNLQELLRKATMQCREKEDKLRQRDSKLIRLEDELSKLKAIIENNDLEVRARLQDELDETHINLQGAEKRLSEYMRHVEILEKNHKHQISIEEKKVIKSNSHLYECQAEIAKLQMALRDKDRMLSYIQMRGSGRNLIKSYNAEKSFKLTEPAPRHRTQANLEESSLPDRQQTYLKTAPLEKTPVIPIAVNDPESHEHSVDPNTAQAGYMETVSHSEVTNAVVKRTESKVNNGDQLKKDSSTLNNVGRSRAMTRHEHDQAEGNQSVFLEQSQIEERKTCLSSQAQGYENSPVVVNDYKNRSLDTLQNEKKSMVKDSKEKINSSVNQVVKPRFRSTVVTMATKTTKKPNVNNNPVVPSMYVNAHQKMAAKRLHRLMMSSNQVESDQPDSLPYERVKKSNKSYASRRATSPDINQLVENIARINNYQQDSTSILASGDEADDQMHEDNYISASIDYEEETYYDSRSSRSSRQVPPPPSCFADESLRLEEKGAGDNPVCSSRFFDSGQHKDFAKPVRHKYRKVINKEIPSSYPCRPSSREEDTDGTEDEDPCSSRGRGDLLLDSQDRNKILSSRHSSRFDYDGDIEREKVVEQLSPHSQSARPVYDPSFFEKLGSWI